MRTDEGRNTLSTADPQAPLVLDTRELGRRPGAQRRVRRQVEAPAGLGIDVLGVPEGSAIELEIRLEAVVEGVLATVETRVRLAGECVRCLEPIERELDVEFQELFAHADSEVEDDEASRLEGDLLDLEPELRDAVLLALPFQPLCRDDCPGLCPDCGARLADEPDHRHEENTDPRWSALAELRLDNNDNAQRD
ncbi:YceD family protein [Tenggerimyces flavus]|uniref:YceD family protein n=1 Tax=Tenggerimyces flavus TaxID=1708749 RepID=A0ABV7YBH6_9ACTN|nr:DUF177 domain-containing protein [Tenggerimyces flavus]MBM7786671.1 uncharacterized protein [Tenggerimyces flavus]